MVCCSKASKEPRGNYHLELREKSRTESSWMSGLQSQRDKPHRRQSVNSCRDEFASGDQWNWRGTGTDRCIGCQYARLELKPADHNEECCARIVRHMTADENLNQRVQIAQEQMVETTPPEARTGERDPVPQPARKKVRFAERVEEQIPEGTVATNSRSTSSSSSSPSSSSSSDPSSSQTSIAPSMQVDESNEDRSKRQNVNSWC